MSSDQKAAKAANQRFALMRGGRLRHIQVDRNAAVTLIGFAADLHGTRCTCCPRRAS